jgi:molecular chaperone IbpA
MRSYDLSPLFRSTVGFDRMTRLLESAMKADESALSYPPYNIEKLSDDAYRITMAVAGFAAEDLEIMSQENVLVITGKARKEEETAQYLHRGIAGRAFERRFQLADHIKVTGAALANGLLHVDLVREIPETLKPRNIRIETTTAAQPQVGQAQAAQPVIDQKAA